MLVKSMIRSILGIDARLGHGQFGRVDGEVGRRLVFCHVQCLNADVFLKVHIGGKASVDFSSSSKICERVFFVTGK